MPVGLGDFVIAGVVAVGRQRLSTEWRYRLLLTGGALLIIFGVLLAHPGSSGAVRDHRGLAAAVRVRMHRRAY